MKVIVPFGEKIATLTFKEIDGDISVDELLYINPSNLMGEALTITVLVNQLGLFVASQREILKTYEFELSIYKAELSESIRRQLAGKYSRVTIEMVQNELLKDQGVVLKHKTLFRLQKELDYLEVLYNAAQRKDTKLNSFARNLHPIEAQQQLLEGEVNNFLIKIKKSF